MNTFFHSGDLGDCIAALPVIRQLGGGRLILGNRNGKGAREPMTKARFEVIAPLLRAQEYITEVIHQDDPPAGEVTHDLHDFRGKPPPHGKGCGELGYNLATWQAAYFGIHDLDLSPWLKVGDKKNESGKQEPSVPEREGYSVFARSLRYQNPRFDWLGMKAKYERALFTGLFEEHQKFLSCFPAFLIPFLPTADLLEVAELIAGSAIFVGNQSAPCWIAIGLGKPLIQEMDQWVINRNSVVARENAQYIG